MDKQHAIMGRIALFITTIVWGISFVVLKSTVNVMGPLWIMALRFSISAILPGILAWREIRKLNRSSIIGGVLLGICLAAAYIVQTYGLKYTTPGKNAFLTTTYVVFVPFLVWALHKHRPTLANIVAAVICIVGIGLVSLGDDDAGINIGDILTLICGFFYALHIIFTAKYVEKSDPVAISAVQFLVGALICWAGALLFENVPGRLTTVDYLNLAYLSVVCTTICFLLQAYGLKYTPSSEASIILCFESVFGVLASVIFMHERLTLKLLVGFILIFAAVVISERNPKWLQRLSCYLIKSHR